MMATTSHCRTAFHTELEHIAIKMVKDIHLHESSLKCFSTLGVVEMSFRDGTKIIYVSSHIYSCSSHDSTAQAAPPDQYFQIPAFSACMRPSMPCEPVT